MPREEAALQAANGSVSGRTALGASAVMSRRALVAAVLALVLGAALFEGVAGERSAVAPAVRSGGFSQKGLLSLPVAAQGPVSAALGADSAAYRVSASDGGFAAASPSERLSSSFGRSGVSVSSGATRVGLSLQAMGYGASLRALGEVIPSMRGNRVVYARSGLQEWYENGPLGLEQGFTIPRAPSGRPEGALTLSIALSGDAHASLASGGQSLTLSRTGGPTLRYSGLSATDARGRLLHGWLELQNGRLLLRVDTRGARYPLRIDPFIQQGEKLMANGCFGCSVALSSDGNTALIGGLADNNWVGAAWVFTRTGETWTQQGPKLTGDGYNHEEFGSSVALSSDGNTALIGVTHTEGGTSVGAAFVLTRSVTRTGPTWTQQGPKLVGDGDSVALSANGNTALTGPYVFTRSGSTWTQQATLSCGIAALSADGDTALEGCPDEGEDNTGAVRLFRRSGETWTQQGETRTEADAFQFGLSVALSAEGNTALIGSAAGAWVFAISGATWTEQAMLTGSEESGDSFFGGSVALSASGDVALVGGRYADDSVGAAWVFTRSGGEWQQDGPKLTGAGSQYFGISVALSSDASTALVGSNDAVWVFVAPHLPIAVTGTASSLTPTSATLNATVNPNGETVSDCHFEYGTSESYGSSVPCTTLPGSDESPAAVSAPLEDLSETTTYHFRVVATNPIGTDYGSDKTFKTLPYYPPTVVTNAASSVTPASATLNATVNPNGETVSDCHFEYGISESYGSSVPCTWLPGSGTSPVEVSAAVVDLSEDTTYHFRIVATNSLGTGYGADQTFKTGPPEFGRCAKVEKGSGKYASSACTSLGGKDEWSSGVIKMGFTTRITSGSATFETVKGSKVATCSGEAGTGEYSGSNTVGGVVVTLTGCERSGEKCSTGLVAGEIVSSPLEGVFGVEQLGASPSKNKIGLALYPAGKTGPLMEFSCGVTTVSLRGSVIVPVKANKMSRTQTLKFKASKGKQKREGFVGEPKDILEASVNGGPVEQTGLTLTTSQTSEEEVEVNSVV